MQAEAMNSYRKVFFAVSAGVALSLLLSMSAVAQGPAELTAATPATTSDALPPAPEPQTSAAANSINVIHVQIKIIII